MQPTRKAPIPVQPQKQRRLLPSRLGAILVFTDGEEKGRQVPLVLTRTVLGRKFGDVLVRDIKVSGTHAAIEFREGEFHLVDLGSSNGTFLGDRKVRDVVLEPGQTIRVGFTALRLEIDPEKATRLAATQPPEVGVAAGGLSEVVEREFLSVREEVMAADTDRIVPGEGLQEKKVSLTVLFGPARGKKFDYEGGATVLGRTKADISLLDPDVSRKHATIERDEAGQLILRDLASTNGTYVNDRRISNCVLGNGDRIKMGSTTLLVTGLKGS